MANEIRTSFQGTATLYAIIRALPSLQVWDGSELVEFDADDLADYGLGLTDFGGDEYAADFPSSLPAGMYRIGIYSQAGASPAADDLRVGTIDRYWNGSALDPDPPGDRVVSWAEVKAHLRLNDASEPPEVTLMVDAAIDYAQIRLGKLLSDYETVPPTIRLAILAHVAALYENRESISERGRQIIPRAYDDYLRLNSDIVGVG